MGGENIDRLHFDYIQTKVEMRRTSIDSHSPSRCYLVLSLGLRMTRIPEGCYAQHALHGSKRTSLQGPSVNHLELLLRCSQSVAPFLTQQSRQENVDASTQIPTQPLQSCRSEWLGW